MLARVRDKSSDEPNVDRVADDLRRYRCLHRDRNYLANLQKGIARLVPEASPMATKIITASSTIDYESKFLRVN